MKTLSLYQQVMGARFTEIPAPLQRFHALEGTHVLSGWVEVGAPASFLARVLARCLGTPLAAQQGPVQFELKTGADSEAWTRHFPGKMMKSRLTQADGHIVERLGFARLWFALEGDSEMLGMKLVRFRFLGVPCPRWLRPAIVAEETATPGHLHFRVQATLPLVGLVASYRGYLKLPEGTCQ